MKCLGRVHVSMFQRKKMFLKSWFVLALFYPFPFCSWPFKFEAVIKCGPEIDRKWKLLHHDNKCQNISFRG